VHVHCARRREGLELRRDVDGVSSHAGEGRGVGPGGGVAKEEPHLARRDAHSRRSEGGGAVGAGGEGGEVGVERGGEGDHARRLVAAQVRRCCVRRGDGSYGAFQASEADAAVAADLDLPHAVGCSNLVDSRIEGRHPLAHARRGHRRALGREALDVDHDDGRLCGSVRAEAERSAKCT
jgi:hypothetical protein